tara:strand:- start:1519 stop:2874 length:1356 start_codon:yes stop_codon:yes gene_type:complete
LNYTDQKKRNNLEKKIYIKTFGCQMNEYDSSRILDITKKINYYPTDNKLEADCYILNTCHIREKATEKVFHDVGRVKKNFRNKKKPILIVAGCVAQAEGDLILKKDKYIDAVIGPQSYHSINEVIKKIENKKRQLDETSFDVIEKFDTLNIIKNSSNKVSSFLTIQEGCNKFCKFCVVPYTRGEECSRKFEDILLEADQLISNGAREITLLGQNVNAYEYANKRLSDIIFALNKREKLKRIRYTTSHPKDMTEDLIYAHTSCEKLMPLLHLPVQSGSNSILRSMNRKHNIKQYLEIIKVLQKKNPKIKFTSDFIIGYPGETNDDFIATCKLMQDIKFINSYSFIFSPRPGTPANELDLIDEKISKKRLNSFQKIAKEIKLNYKKNLLNTKVNTLFENKVEEDSYFGRDEYQNPVIATSKQDIIGEVKEVIIKKFTQHTIYGNLIDKNILAA